jgi:pSer/pThr/pTyr-binding forkhead associated (FHA) protein
MGAMREETAGSEGGDWAERPTRPDAPVPPGGSLCVLRGFYEGLEVALDRDWVVVGRGRGADVVLAEPTISRAHAAIGWERDEGFFVQDLGSTNGTLVNGARQERARLKSGDEIQMGKLRLKVTLPA